MRLNHDCIRDFLLYFERHVGLEEYLDSKDIAKFEVESKYSSDDIIYSIQKLHEANFIVANFYYADDSLYNMSVDKLTWAGHHFLDTVRDNKVWKSTKGITSKFSSVSISLIEKIASNVITELIKNSLP